MLLPDLWYRNAVVYSLDLETFQDSDGDGCGDFEGLSRRLDYLESLGVNTVWLGPFQPTPNRDNGYDIADYYGVDPRHGTLGDFVEFLHEAKSRGIRVVMDLVVNHTSDRHPWFRDARRSTSAPYHDWYVWSKKRPPNWKSGMVFPGVQERTWTRAPEVRKYYFHRFYDFQPDLNMENPEVREEVRRIMGFWLALGVAGFRLDAVPFILEKPSADGGAQPLRFEYLEEMRRFIQWRVGDAVLLGEANVLPEEARRYFSERGGLHMMFNFWVNQHAFYALASGDAKPLTQALRATRTLPPTAQWAQFLRNHDELDLGRLTEEQRQAVFERFGPEPRMQLYDRGIRRRLAPMLGDRRRLELAYSLMFSLPGTPVVYYGEEIGMGDNLALAERGRRAHADAVVGGAERRVHRRREARHAARLRRAVRLRDGERRQPAARPRLAPALDDPDDPAPHPVPGDRLGRVQARRDPLATRARAALSLARVGRSLRPQLRRAPARGDAAPRGRGRRPARRPDRRRALREP